MDAVNNSAPDNTSVPISEDNVTAPSIDQSRRSRERAVGLITDLNSYLKGYYLLKQK